MEVEALASLVAMGHSRSGRNLGSTHATSASVAHFAPARPHILPPPSPQTPVEASSLRSEHPTTFYLNVTIETNVRKNQ